MGERKEGKQEERKEGRNKDRKEEGKEDILKRNEWIKGARKYIEVE